MKRRLDALRQLPLRLKVAIWTGGLVGLVLLGIAAGVVIHLYVEGIEELDKTLAHAATRFFHQMHSKSEPVDWNDTDRIAQMFDSDAEVYFEVFDAQERMLHRSHLLERVDLPKVETNAQPVLAHSRGKPLRVAAYEQDGIRLVLGVNAHMVFETREDILRTFLVACPIAFVLVAFGGWWIAGRALAPVAEVTAAAKAITAERLDQRLPIPAADDEIGRLTAVLNAMIDRLEASFHQARRFSADASHELRTPLTILRGEIESALREPALAPAQERLLLDLLEEVEGLSRITDGLLLLSRADAGRLQVEKEPVDLSRLLGELLEDVEILAGAEEVQVETRIEGGVTVQGYEPFLRQLVLNLLDNALKYNRPSGRVRIGLDATDCEARLVVGNTGPGVESDQAEHLFERFYRGARAQSSRRRGHGLGLSICREIARAHGGEITLAKAEPDWTEFCVALPVAVAGARMNAI